MMMTLSRAVLCISLMTCLFSVASGFLSTGPTFVLARERVGPAACRSSRTCTQKLLATIAGRSEVEADRSIVRKVAMEKEGELQTVVEAMKRLEKASRAQKDETQNSMMLQKLTGKWRLICSTGDKSGKTVTGAEEGKLNHLPSFRAMKDSRGGKLTYFPVKAVQEFDTRTKFIKNGVYLGPISFEFSGELELFPKMRRLEFFFNKIALGPFSLPILVGKDAKVKPSFSWIDVTDDYALARGAGGGFGLWRKVDAI